MLLNTDQNYGLVAIALHWLIACSVFGLFGLGFWMVDLDYYHTWYRQGPDLHRSIGVITVAAMVMRLSWRIISPPPKLVDSTSLIEKRLAGLAYGGFYMLIMLLGLSGYLISTADGRSLPVFEWLEIPAITTSIENQEDLAGDIHEILAYSLITLALIHLFAALKHHFINRDQTLRRMLGISKSI